MSSHPKHVGNDSDALPPLTPYEKTLKAIKRDMPILMHGSGDVLPQEQDQDAVHVVSELTMGYIDQLVDAAIQAHHLLNGKPCQLPPKSFSKRPEPPKPAPYDPKSKKRLRSKYDYFDQPLAEPKIKGKPTAKEAKNTGEVDRWVGVAGVDFWGESRARRAHVTAPSAIGTQSFIFPICHDEQLYGKVLNIQTAQRAMAPVLMDSVIMDVVRAEGALQGPSALRKRDTPANADGTPSEAKEAEDTDSEDEGGPTFPGLDGLLPYYSDFDHKGYASGPSGTTERPS